MSRLRLLLMLVACLGAAQPTPAVAQSPQRGLLSGVVTTQQGRPVVDALVHVTDRATGHRQIVRTDPDGRFDLPPLLNGEYEVTVEKLGFRPVRVPRVAVRTGRTSALALHLRTAAPPVTTVDTLWLGGGGRLATPGGGRTFGDLELRALPHEDGTLDDLTTLSTRAGPDGSFQGLPRRMTAISIDGFLHRPVTHPGLAVEGDADPLVALSFMEDAELLLGASPAIWPRPLGPVLQANTARGTERPTGHVTARYGSFDATASPLSDADAGRDDLIGSALFRGPLLSDTAHFSAGAWVRSTDRPVPPAFTDPALGEALSGVSDGGAELARYGEPGTQGEVAASGFARVDWRLGDRTTLTALGLTGFVRREADTGLPRPGLHDLDRQSFLGGAALGAAITDDLYSETRVSIDLASDDFTAPSDPEADVPATWLTAGGLTLGADPRLPARIEQRTLDLSQSFQLRSRSHRLELAAGLSLASHTQAWTWAPDGLFLFGGVDQLGSGEGAFVRTTGAGAEADFSVTRLSVLLQDRWTPVEGLDLEFGVRGTREGLPRDDIRRNAAWATLTGIDNTAFDDAQLYLNPHVSFLWNIDNRHEWLVHGSAATIQEESEPWVLGEAIAFAAGTDVRRQFGALGDWPDTPPEAGSTTGERLTLLDEDFEAPRTDRFGLGITRGLGAGTLIHVEGVYRATSGLAVRENLNRPVRLAGDQHGRALYGVLRKSGGLLVAEPGSNRRFDAFDDVYRITADGNSEYWGLTLALERRSSGPLDLYAAYTFSETKDDLPGLAGRGLAGDAFVPPSPLEVGEARTLGTSDLDRPHNVVLAGSVQGGGRFAPSISAAYRYAAGAPFTPGFAPGVDANGDGSAWNDVAFVDDGVAGMDELLAGQECLRSQVGSLAERGSCRTDGRHSLSIRGAIGFSGEGSAFTGGLFAEVVGLLDEGAGPVDAALYAIDPDAPLVRDAGAGTVTVPLVANPGFGEPRTEFTTGPVVRVGLFLRY